VRERHTGYIERRDLRRTTAKVQRCDRNRRCRSDVRRLFERWQPNFELPVAVPRDVHVRHRLRSKMLRLACAAKARDGREKKNYKPSSHH
jgi:hypothetical protein